MEERSKGPAPPIGPDRLAGARRPIAGTTRDTSALGIELNADTLGVPSNDERTIALLRTARAAGVTTFRLAPGRAGARGERLLSNAFPEPDPEILVLAPRTRRQLAESAERSGRSSGDLEERLRASLEESNARLAPHSVGLLEWSEPDPPAPSDDARPGLDRLRAEGILVDWLVPTETAIERWGPAPEGPDRPTLVIGSLSVLDRRLLDPLRTRAERRPLGVFARDPLAGGRLDGSRFDRSLGERSPGERPSSVRELHAEFSPVLALGFLSEGRVRTLAQASLQFTLHWPWVCAALVPMPRPERLGELLAAGSRPPLTPENIDRILSLDSRTA